MCRSLWLVGAWLLINCNPAAGKTKVDNVKLPSLGEDLALSVTALQRQGLLKDSDFIFDFNIGSTKRPQQPTLANGLNAVPGPNLFTVAASIANFPALIGEDVSLTVGMLGPCALVTPHTHPRASEFMYLVNGSVLTGMLQENGARYIEEHAASGQAVLFPRGSIHYEANMGCKPAMFVSALNNPDPGVLQIAQGLFGLSYSVLDPVFGHHLTSYQLSILKEMIPPNITYGVSECLKRCNIKPVKGHTVPQSVLKDLLNHSHIAGYAYGIFIIGLLAFYTVFQQVEKFRFGNHLRLGPRRRRYLMYAPTIVFREEVVVKRKVIKEGIKLELPANSDTILVVIFVLMNLALAMWDVEHERPRRLFFQRVGWLGIWNTVGAVILAMKTSPLPWLLGKSHDNLVFYHKTMAYTAFAEIWIHSIWGMYVIPLQNPEHKFYWTQAQTGAWISTPAFTIMVITAGSAVFLKHYFEAFLVIHVVGYVTLLVGLWLHNQLLAYYALALVVLWVFDRIFRMSRIIYLFRTRVSDVASLSQTRGGTKVSFMSKTKWRAGSHIYINFQHSELRAYSLQSHPYTIASIPIQRKDEPNFKIELLIQGKTDGTGFSSALARFTKRYRPSAECRFIFHGPYGAAPNMKHYDRVLCIGGGSGITLPIAMTQSFLQKQKSRGRGKVDLVWSSPKFSDFAMFDLVTMSEAGANIFLYETQPEKSNDITATIIRTATALLVPSAAEKNTREGGDKEGSNLVEQPRSGLIRSMSSYIQNIPQKVIRTGTVDSIDEAIGKNLRRGLKTVSRAKRKIFDGPNSQTYSNIDDRKDTLQMINDMLEETKRFESDEGLDITEFEGSETAESICLRSIHHPTRSIFTPTVRFEDEELPVQHQEWYRESMERAYAIDTSYKTQPEIISMTSENESDDDDDDTCKSVDGTATMSAEHYKGRMSAPQAHPAGHITGAETMPSFISSKDNRFLHRRANTFRESDSLSNALETSITSSPVGTGIADQLLQRESLEPEPPTIERLRELFEPIGKGRIPFEKIIKNFVGRADKDDTLCVVVCGLPSMCRQVRNVIALLEASQKIDFHVEQL